MVVPVHIRGGHAPADHDLGNATSSSLKRIVKPVGAQPPVA